MNINEFNIKTQRLKKENEAFYRKLKLKTPKNLDALFHEAHE